MAVMVEAVETDPGLWSTDEAREATLEEAEAVMVTKGRR